MYSEEIYEIYVPFLARNKVNIDGPCELLVRRSKEKLFAYCKVNIWIGNFQALTYYIRPDTIGSIYKSESLDSFFRNELAKHRLMI